MSVSRVNGKEECAQTPQMVALPSVTMVRKEAMGNGLLPALGSFSWAFLDPSEASKAICIQDSVNC